MATTSERERGEVHVRRGDGAAAARPEAAAKALPQRAPAVDIFEREDGLVLRADLPGVASDGVKLDVDRDVLTIRARSAGELPGAPIWSEIAPVEYYRAFSLGEDLDPARITATMRNGVLELVLPKAERAKTKKIKVEQG